MNETTGTEQQSAGAPLRRHAVGDEPDWAVMTAEELVAYRVAENRRRSSPAVHAITGTPDPGAAIEWRHVALPGRDLPVRVYRPAPGPSDAPAAGLPLVLHVHGGGFVGTAPQCDWANSHLAARLPAVVVSVEHRLLAPDSPLSDAVDDSWDVLRHVVEHAERWGVDPARAAVFGESCGALINALVALRTCGTGLRLQAQVLVNPAVDVTGAMLDYPSVSQHADSPTLTLPQLQLFRRLAVPPGMDPRPLSPLHAEDFSGPAPALVQVPTEDPLADHGRHYAERLQVAGTPVRLTEYAGAGHAFLTMSRLVPQAEAARAEIVEFLRAALTG